MSFFLYIVYELLVGLAAATWGKEDPRGASYDRDQLVHVPNRLFVPNVRLLSSEGNRVHPSGLLHLGHHFQMRSRHSHLPDLLRQVWQEGSLAMSMCMRWQAWLDFGSFSSRTDTFNFYRRCRSVGSGSSRLR